MGKYQAGVLDAFGHVDVVWAWPYDQGGCACERCAPWGCNGFLRASEQLSRLFHERSPKGKFLLSTWFFDALDEHGGISWDGLLSDVEYSGLFRYLREKKPDWIQGIIVGSFGDWIPEPLLKRPFPKKYPLVNFPEISMNRMIPWGGYGANPLPGYCTRRANKLRDHLMGGYPYSEGVYEDINKFFWMRWYWDPSQSTDDILAEYATYYLEPNSANDAVRLFHLLEKTHPRRKGWEVDNLAEADEAWALVQAIDGRLVPRVKRSWRWRIIYLRSAIDHVLKNKGYRTADARAALTPLCDELVEIYHAQDGFIRPPIPGNIAFRKPIEGSSDHPDLGYPPAVLVNGICAQHHQADYWAHDPAKEKTATLVVDTGTVVGIKEARIQFRESDGLFRYVPESVSFDVSVDGKTFEPVGTLTNVPKEGAPYSTPFGVCRIGKKARYVRINLGPSQCINENDPYPGMLQLAEVQVFSE